MNIAFVFVEASPKSAANSIEKDIRVVTRFKSDQFHFKDLNCNITFLFHLFEADFGIQNAQSAFHFSYLSRIFESIFELNNSFQAQFRVPSVLRLQEDQNGRLTSVLTSVNAPNEHKESATLLVKPDQPSTFLDVWTPYYLTIQRQNKENGGRAVPFSHVTPRSFPYAGESDPAAAFNNGDYPRRQAEHQYIQALQSAALQAQYPQQVVNANYPQLLQQQSAQLSAGAINPQQFQQLPVQQSAGIVYPQQFQQFVQVPAGVVYPQQLQPQFVQAAAPSAAAAVPVVVPTTAAPTGPTTEPPPFRQSFDDETRAPQYTLPYAPFMYLPVESANSPAAPVVAQNAAVIASETVAAQPAATAALPAATESTIASSSVAESSEASSTEASTPAAPSTAGSTSGVSNGYPIDPQYYAYKQSNLPLTFKTVGDQFDRFMSSVNVREMIHSGVNVLDLSAQGLENLIGRPVKIPKWLRPFAERAAAAAPVEKNEEQS